ncbi:MAG: hypothetical protein ACE5LH_06135 [Fidelibacterota bacterium]
MSAAQSQGPGTLTAHPRKESLLHASERVKLLALYHDWLALNKPLYAKYYSVLAVLFMAILIPFDFVLFENGIYFTRFRAVSIIVLTLNLLLLMIQHERRKGPNGTRLDPVLLLPGILFNFLYTYFLFSVDGSPYRIVLIANFMVVFFTTFFVHRFWKEQYLLNLSSIAFLILMATLKPAMAGDAILLVICHISSFIAAFFFRREFVASMYAFVRRKA